MSKFKSFLKEETFGWKAFKDKIYLEDGEVLPGTLIWSAGIKGNPTPGDGEAYWNKRERVEVNKS